MSYNAWTSPFLPMVDDAAVALTNTVTQTAISPGALTNPMYAPGNTIKAGCIIELKAWGTVSTSGTTPTLIIGFYWGALTLALAATTAITLTNQVGVAWQWELHYSGRVTQNGTAGSINGSGRFENPTSLVAFTPRRIPETVAGQTVAIDTSINKPVVVGATWGAAAATNIIVCNGMRGGVWG